MFFYLIYSLDWGKDLPSGKRNSRVFFFGWMLYTILYVIIKNMMLNNSLGLFGDSVYTGFLLMAFGDIATMAYLYRYKYDRVIFHELGEDVDKKWYFDESTNKYSLNKQPILHEDNIVPSTSCNLEDSSNNKP